MTILQQHASDSDATSPEAATPPGVKRSKCHITRWSWLHSLLLKQSLFVGVIVVMTAGILGHSAYLFARSVLRDQIHQHLTAIAASRAILLENYVSQQLERVALVASRTRLRQLLAEYSRSEIPEDSFREQTKKILLDARAGSDSFVDIWITDAAGEVVTSTDDSLLDSSFAQNSDFLAGRQRRHMGVPEMVSGTFLANLCAPVPTEDKQTSHVTMIRFDSRRLLRLLASREGLGRTGDVVIATPEGKGLLYLSPRRGASHVETSTKTATPMMNAIQGDIGADVMDYDGVSVLAAFRPVHYHPPEVRKWGLVAMMDADEAYVPVERLRRSLLLLEAACLLAGLVASYRLSRRLTLPILNLTEKAADIARGRLDARVEITSRDEIGTLGASFNHMADEVFRAREELEQRVRERTHELSQSQMESRRQARILQSVLDSIGDGIVVADEHGEFLHWNPAAERIIGYGARSVEPQEWSQTYGLFLPDGSTYCPVNQLPLARAMRGESLDDVELFLRSPEVPDGTLISVNARPLLNDQGELRGGVAVFCDVTELRRAEQELKTRDELNRTILATAHEAFIEIDESSTICEWNEQAEATFGWPRDEAIGRSLPDLIIPRRFRQKHLQGVQHFLKTGEAPLMNRRLELSAIHRDGHEFPIELSFAPVKLENKYFFSAFLHDVTEQKASQEELRQSNQKLDRVNTQLVTVLNAAVRALVVATDTDGRVTVFNSGAEKLLGYRADEIIGKVTPAIWHDSEEMQKRGAALEEELGKPVSGFDTFVSKAAIVGYDEREWTFIRKDGERRLVLLNVTPQKIRDEIVGYLGVGIDITDRKAYERDLIKTREAAEAANEAKSAFLANMSHEIRTPMNAIVGMTELLLDTDLNSIQHEYAAMIQESGDSLLSVINDILDFSKIEAGKFNLDEAEFDLWENVGDTAKSIAVRAHGKGLELACYIAPDVPQFVSGDRFRLRQILVNLLGNAIKFTETGEVVLRVDVQASNSTHSTLHFAVSDTGIGIPQDKQKAIFQAFEQADDSTTRRFGGTGLGLTISSRLVELMGGDIWLESELGHGSAFHFTVRVARSDRQHAPAVVPPPEALQGLDVLVVDDNTTNLRILQETLRTWNMQPTCLDTAEDALECFRTATEAEHPFSLVLTDAQLNGTDGFLLARQMLDISRPSKPLIIMLTSQDQAEDNERSRQAGIAACLRKPVKQSELFDAITRAIANDTVPVSSEKIMERETEPSVPPLHILLVEDSVINQKVALEQLKKGHHNVTVANNGLEALELLEQQVFDVVLMDIQMPEMDGLQATAALREREHKTGGHIPVIAMTAHAMKGDRERCLAAGMDDYVAKPVRFKYLSDALARVTNARTATGPRKVTEPILPDNMPEGADDDADIVDWKAAIDLVGGDTESIRELAELFCQECPHMMDEIRQAIRDSDARSLRRAAHTLKGSAAVFHAQAVADTALQLENMGRDGDIDSARQQFSTLEQRVQLLIRAFNRYLEATAV